MRNPVILTKVSGKKIAIDATDVKKIVDEGDVRHVFDKKGNTYVVAEHFENLCELCTVKSTRAAKTKR